MKTSKNAPNGSNAKSATTVITVRVTEMLKKLLIRAAELENEGLSPYVARILSSDPAVQRLLIGEPPLRRKPQWTIDEVGMALLSQLALIGQGIEQLSDVLCQDLHAHRPADVLMVCMQLRRLEEQLERLYPLNVLRHTSRS